MITEKEKEERLVEFIQGISKEFDASFKVLEAKFEGMPPQLKANGLTGILIAKIGEQTVIIRDNSLKPEAAAFKVLLEIIIGELEKA